jgi:hypothetical protein
LSTEEVRMMTRIGRTVWIMAALCSLIAASLGAEDKLPVPAALGSAVALDLKGQLERGLYARRPEEFASIAKVVALVESGALPRSIVDSTFGWARKKPTRRLQYFQFALTARARQEGIPLDIGAGQ